MTLFKLIVYFAMSQNKMITHPTRPTLSDIIFYCKMKMNYNNVNLALHLCKTKY